VQWPTGVGAKGNEGVAAQLSQIDGGIGYVELAYVKGRLQAAAIENGSGEQVVPTNATASRALGSIDLGPDLIGSNANPMNGYPIVTFSWVLAYANGNGNNTSLLKTTFDYMLSEESQAKAPELGYVSLPPDVIAQAKAAANTIKE
jgi:phosphate transport system substrate-binding protein